MNEQKIIQGDCLEVMRGFRDETFDLVLTDPPYFLPANLYVGKRGSAYKRQDADASILRNFFKQVFLELDRVTTKNASWYVFCDAQSYPIFSEAMFPYCKYVRLLVWDKLVSYNGYTWRHQHELIAWGERDEAVRVPTGDGDVLKCRGVLQKDRNHPAEKPVELLKKILEKHESTNVLDPFMGSASTLVAAKEVGRNATGIELSEDYFEVARKRLEQEQLF